jgi:phosphocarrier protein HPr
MTQVLQRTVEIINKRGLHARASSKFAMLAGRFDGTHITVRRDDQTVEGDSIMDLLMLAAGIGAQIEITASGPAAEEALQELCDLVSDRFGEGE